MGILNKVFIGLAGIGLCVLMFFTYKYYIIPREISQAVKPWVHKSDSLTEANKELNRQYIAQGEKLEYTTANLDAINTDFELLKQNNNLLQLQHRDIVKKYNASESMVAKLQTGVRVDLVTKTKEKNWLGKIKNIDSVYVKGWKYGEQQ